MEYFFKGQVYIILIFSEACADHEETTYQDDIIKLSNFSKYKWESCDIGWPIAVSTGAAVLLNVH